MSVYNSDVDICNIAADLLHESHIESLTENNNAARTFNRNYAKSRANVLARGRFKMAKKTKALTNETDAPLHPTWTKSSIIPGDELAIIAVWNGDPDQQYSTTIPEEEWDREGDLLLHNLETGPYLEYIWDNPDVSRYGALLGEAIAYHLAARSARKITGSPKMARELREEFEKIILPEAQLKEGMQGRVGENLKTRARLARSPFVRARRVNRLGSR